MARIKYSDISVVVQGSVNSSNTKNVLLSIRKFLPSAEIVLSTWKGSITNGLDYDTLIENEDPGAEVLFPQWNQLHNLNRQILSTKNGINCASKKYCLKIRSDIQLVNNSFLDFFLKHTVRCDEYKFLKERVLICQYYARYPEVFPFHIGDWVFFGYTEDVQNIWDIPLAPEPETTKWFYSHNLEPEHLNNMPYSHFRHRYCAEQYIWSNFLRKYIKLNFEHMFDKSPENTRITEMSFVNNLVILSPRQFSIKFLKGYSGNEVDIYTYHTWQILYKKYCDKSYHVVFIKEKSLGQIFKLLYKAKVHLAEVLKPIRAIYLWLRACLTLIYKTVKYLLNYFLSLSKSKKFLLYNNNEIEYLKKILKNLKDQNVRTRNIVLFTVHLGEAYVFANIYTLIARIYNNPVCATCYKDSIKIFKLFIPNLNIIYIPLEPRQLVLNTYFIGNDTVNVLLPDNFWHVFWRTKQHFIIALERHFGYNIERELFHSPIINQMVNGELEEKSGKIGLNISNFIVFCPESNTTKPLPIIFWQSIFNTLSDLGYDVFINCVKQFNISDIPGGKSCFLNLAEFYVLTNMSRGIIALRSGILEILVELHIHKHIIYSKSVIDEFIKYLSANYSLKGYPRVDPETLHEYYLHDENDLMNIREKIVESFTCKNYDYLETSVFE
jgi:hypothetical protein